MDENTMQQITASTERLAAAAEALQQTMAAISAKQDEISAKIDKIVAAIEDNPADPALSARAAERTGHPAANAGHHPAVHAQRRTLSPLVTMILAKNGIDEPTSDTAQLDKALLPLSPEQRIAVKTEMARVGIIQ